MKKISATLAAMLCCIVMTTTLTSCGDDNNNEPDEPAIVKCTYELTLWAGTGADDQQDIVKTTVTVPNYNGEETREFMSVYEEFSVKPSNDFDAMPIAKTITINQSLLENADTVSKDSYKVGLHYKLVVTTLDGKNNVIDQKMTETDNAMTVRKDRLGKLYPRTTTLKFSADENGKVSL